MSEQTTETPSQEKARRIYVASSWRNGYQQAVVESLRQLGHEVYDFRHPAPGNDGFHWSEIDPAWKDWNQSAFAAALQHPIAVDGFGRDMSALEWCDTCVLVLPCGRSAHLEAGWAAGSGRRVVVYVPEPVEPELMYRMTATVASTWDEVVSALAEPRTLDAARAAAELKGPDELRPVAEALLQRMSQSEHGIEGPHLDAARAEEREACALVVERLAGSVSLAAEDLPLGAEKRPGVWPEGVSAYNLERYRAEAIKEGAAAIRARGEQRG